jgi:hypothetical protein
LVQWGLALNLVGRTRNCNREEAETTLMAAELDYTGGERKKIKKDGVV